MLCLHPVRLEVIYPIEISQNRSRELEMIWINRISYHLFTLPDIYCRIFSTHCLPFQDIKSLWYFQDAFYNILGPYANLWGSFPFISLNFR